MFLLRLASFAILYSAQASLNDFIKFKQVEYENLPSKLLWILVRLLF